MRKEKKIRSYAILRYYAPVFQGLAEFNLPVYSLLPFLLLKEQ